VYDLDIENTHNFVANGLITHNSIYGWRGARSRTFNASPTISRYANHPPGTELPFTHNISRPRTRSSPQRRRLGKTCGPPTATASRSSFTRPSTRPTRCGSWSSASASGWKPAASAATRRSSTAPTPSRGCSRNADRGGAILPNLWRPALLRAGRNQGCPGLSPTGRSSRR